jgi:hypothetical protein
MEIITKVVFINLSYSIPCSEAALGNKPFPHRSICHTTKKKNKNPKMSINWAWFLFSLGNILKSPVVLKNFPVVKVSKRNNTIKSKE